MPCLGKGAVAGLQAWAATAAAAPWDDPALYLAGAGAVGCGFGGSGQGQRLGPVSLRRAAD